MGFCRSRRSSYVLGRGIRSASMEECLPHEMLEAILGKLDRETLCTTRLVSRTFCAAASVNMPSLTLKSTSQAISLERFPRLGHVTVHHIGDDESLAELDPCLCPVITQLTVSPIEGCVRMALPELPEMPKLRELDVYVDKYSDPFANCPLDGAEVLRRLTSLEVLRIGDCTPSVATTITTTTWLTELVIGLVTRPGERWMTADFSWLQHATNLRKLEALQISISLEALPLIGSLTGLTGLTWVGGCPGFWDMDDTYSIAPLSRLSRLRCLEIVPWISESNLAIACSLASCSLAGLRVRVEPDASADCGRLLVRQTALTRLGVGGEQLCNSRHLVFMRMELLQSLELLELDPGKAEGLDALQKATSLTHLRMRMCTSNKHLDVGLSQTLARLTQLRSLQLTFALGGIDAKVLNYCVALSPLTALTQLQISVGRLDSGDLRALLGLTGLQVLDLDGYGLTDDVVPELAVLTILKTLRLRFHGVTSLAPATNLINPLRQARGWPPVHASCG